MGGFFPVKCIDLLIATLTLVRRGTQLNGTADAHDSLEAMRINYEFTTTDHVSFSLSINLDNLPTLLSLCRENRLV